MKTDKKEEVKDSTNEAEKLLNLPVSTTTYSFASQRTNKGWLVFATDRNGIVTALTYVPD